MNNLVRKILIIIFLFMVMLALLAFDFGQNLVPFEPKSLAAIGFILLTAYTVGELVQRLGPPSVVGYILTGIAFGPSLTRVLFGPETEALFSNGVIEDLGLVNKLALGLIGLTAGGELLIGQLKKDAKSIGGILLSQTVLVSLGVGGSIFLLAYFYPSALPFLPADGAWKMYLGAAMIFGALSVGTSPATTLAVISETQAQGPLKNLTLGLIIAKDVSTVTFYLLMLSIAIVLTTGKPFEMEVFKEIGAELGFAILLGAILGAIFWTYLKWVHQERMLFTVAIVFIGNWLAKQFHAEALLLFIAAGFVVAHGDQIYAAILNVWRGRKGGLDSEPEPEKEHHDDDHAHEDDHGHGHGHGHRDVGHEMIHELERLSLPTFVVFFTIAAAQLDLTAVPTFWLVALVYIVVRAVMMFVGTQVGIKLVKESGKIKRFLWLGMFAQAGVTLTIVDIAANKAIPLPWAAELKTIVMATILVNIIVGPTLLKLGLIRSGAAGTPDSIQDDEAVVTDTNDPSEVALDGTTPTVVFREPNFESKKLNEHLERLRQQLRGIVLAADKDYITPRSESLERIFEQASQAIVDVLNSTLHELESYQDGVQAFPRDVAELSSENIPAWADREALKEMLRKGRHTLAERFSQIVQAEGHTSIERDAMEQALQAILNETEQLCATQSGYLVVAQEMERFTSNEDDGLFARTIKSIKRLGRSVGGFRTRTIPLMKAARFYVELQTPKQLLRTVNLLGSQRLYTWQKIQILYKLSTSVYLESLEFLDKASMLWRRTAAERSEILRVSGSLPQLSRDAQKDSASSNDDEIEALEAELSGSRINESNRPAVLELIDFFRDRLKDLNHDNDPATLGECQRAHQDLNTFQTDVQRSLGHAIAKPYHDLLDAVEKAGTFELFEGSYNPSRRFDASYHDRLQMTEAVTNWRMIQNGFTNRMELQLELNRIEGQLRSTLGDAIGQLDRELLATLAYYPIEFAERMNECRNRIDPLLQPGADMNTVRKEINRDRKLLMTFLQDNILEDIQEVRESRRFDELLDQLRIGLRKITEGALPVIKIVTKDLNTHSEITAPSISSLEIPLKAVLQEALEREVAVPLSDADMRLKILLDRVITEFTDFGRVINFNLEAASSELSNKIKDEGKEPVVPPPTRSQGNTPSGIMLAREFAVGGLDRSIERLQVLVLHIEEVKQIIDDLILKETVNQIRQVRALMEDSDSNAIRTFLAARDLTKTEAERADGIAVQTQNQFKMFWTNRIEPISNGIKKLVRRSVGLEEIDANLVPLTVQIAALDDRLEGWGTDDLPNIYKRLFSPNLVDVSDFFIPRPEVFASFNQAVEQWLHGRFTTISVIGEPGAGRQSFIEQALQGRLDGMPIIRRRLVHTVTTESDLAEELSSIAGGHRFRDLSHLKAKLSGRKDRSVVILEGAENLFLRSLEGFNTLQKFLHLVSDTGDTLLWVITMDIHAWNYLESVQQIGHQFTHPVVLRPLGRDELQNLILTRHRASGYQLLYTNQIQGFQQIRLMLAQVLGQTEDRQAMLQRAYFDELFDLSQGNPMLAIYYWMQSLHLWSESEHTLRVAPITPIELNFLETLDKETLLGLASIMLHNGLTAREFAEVFDIDESSAQSLLQYLLHLRLVHIKPAVENMFQLNRILYKAIVRRLTQHNML